VTILVTSARNAEAAGRRVLQQKAVQALHRWFGVHVAVLQPARGVQQPGSTDENVLFDIQDPIQIETRKPYLEEADGAEMK